MKECETEEYSEKIQKEKAFFTKPLNILLIAIIANALWASAVPMIKMGYDFFKIEDAALFDKFIFAGIRFAVAGLLVSLFNCIGKRKPVIPEKKDIKGILLLGCIQTTLQYVFFYTSLVSLTGVKASIINSSGNFFAVILAHFAFKDDKMTLRKAVGCILGFIGVLICNFDSSLEMSFSLVGEGFMIIAAFCSASGYVITKPASNITDSTALTGWQLALGGIILIIVGVVGGGKIYFYRVECVLVLAYLSSLSAIAFSLWAKLLRYNYVGKISIFGFLNPIFGVILSGLILGEDFFDFRVAAALLCVSFGIYVVNYKKIKLAHNKEL